MTMKGLFCSWFVDGLLVNVMMFGALFDYGGGVMYYDNWVFLILLFDAEEG